MRRLLVFTIATFCAMASAQAQLGTYLMVCNGPCLAPDGTMQPDGTAVNKTIADPTTWPFQQYRLVPDDRRPFYQPAAETVTPPAPGLYDVRDFFKPTSATCANVAPAVEAAVAAGARKVRIPANCIYIPPNNVTPPDVLIEGDDWNTSIVSVVDRSIDTLLMGPRSGMKNVAIISRFCDQQAAPGGVQKMCPVGEARNNGDSPQPITNWVYQSLFTMSGPRVTGPTGVTSTDIPQIACITSAPGADCHYIETQAPSASGLRIVTSSSAGPDIGIYLLNGLYNPDKSNRHWGIYAKEFGTNSSALGATIRLSRVGDGTEVAQSLLIDDADATGGYSAPFINLVSSHQARGQMINVYQAGAFGGNGLQMNFGNAGGSFNGNFLLFQVANSTVFSVSAAGVVNAAGYRTGAAIGVSCAAGTVSLATLVVTNGIVTHC